MKKIDLIKQRVKENNGIYKSSEIFWDRFYKFMEELEEDEYVCDWCCSCGEDEACSKCAYRDEHDEDYDNEDNQDYTVIIIEHNA